MSKWIKTSHRTPTDYESVKYNGQFLITEKSVNRPYVAMWNSVRKEWQDEYGVIKNVVAWQKLPKICIEEEK